jgi:hypothetical protein
LAVVLTLDLRSEEEVAVGFLHVAIQKLDRFFSAKGKCGGEKRFTGASFTAAHNDSHIFLP